MASLIDGEYVLCYSLMCSGRSQRICYCLGKVVVWVVVFVAGGKGHNLLNISTFSLMTYENPGHK